MAGSNNHHDTIIQVLILRAISMLLYNDKVHKFDKSIKPKNVIFL